MCSFNSQLIVNPSSVICNHTKHPEGSCGVMSPSGGGCDEHLTLQSFISGNQQVECVLKKINCNIQKKKSSKLLQKCYCCKTATNKINKNYWCTVWRWSHIRFSFKCFLEEVPPKQHLQPTSSTHTLCSFSIEDVRTYIYLSRRS